jgi:hypothetical protein
LFLPGNTIFLKKYSPVGSDTLFYTTLPSSERHNLDSFVKKTDTFSDSLEDVNPGEERFALYLDYGNERHALYVHSLHPPKAFAKFDNWINKINDSLNFILIDTSIKFKDDQIIHKVLDKNSR